MLSAVGHKVEPRPCSAAPGVTCPSSLSPQSPPAALLFNLSPSVPACQIFHTWSLIRSFYAAPPTAAGHPSVLAHRPRNTFFFISQGGTRTPPPPPSPLPPTLHIPEVAARAMRLKNRLRNWGRLFDIEEIGLSGVRPGGGVGGLQIGRGAKSFVCAASGESTAAGSEGGKQSDGPDRNHESSPNKSFTSFFLPFVLAVQLAPPWLI